jgi:hypothetical protein
MRLSTLCANSDEKLIEMAIKKARSQTLSWGKVSSCPVVRGPLTGALLGRSGSAISSALLRSLTIKERKYLAPSPKEKRSASSTSHLKSRLCLEIRHGKNLILQLNYL